MKLIATIIVLSASFLSTSVMAEGQKMGSKIKNSVVINASSVKDSNAIAVGHNVKATQGAINIKGSTVKNSAIINATKIEDSNAVAVGHNAEAHQGAINVE